jgi:peptide/nickel transport system substrate-binding protein
MLSNKRWFMIASAVMVIALVLAACGTPAPPPPPAETPAPGETPAPAATPTEAPPPPPPPVEVKNPDTFIECTIGDNETLDPSWHYDTSSATAIWQVYESPVFFDRERVDSFVPMLATDWDISEDAMTYTFYMREGVTFHEGGTMEPHDFAYSIWRGMIQDRAGGPQWFMLEPLVGVSTIEDLAEEVGDVAACEAVKESVTYDDEAGTVTFHLVTPFAPWMQIMAQPFASIMDMEWMIEIGAWDGDCANWRDWHDPAAEESEIFEIMNGTGPYILDYWHPEEERAYVRNDNYWRTEPMWEGGPSGPAVMERYVHKTVDEWSTRLAMMEAGDCDWIYVPRQYIAQVEPLLNEDYVGGEMDPDKLTVVDPNGTIRLFKDNPGVISADTFFNWNVNAEGGNTVIGTGEWGTGGIPPDFFSDEHVRKAFNYCFDWDTFIQDVRMGESVQRRGPIIEGMFGFNPDQEIFTYDLDKCAEEFALAWDGKVMEEGFFVQYLYNTGNDTRRAAGEIFEANVESISDNFAITVSDMPWPAYLRQLVDGRLALFTIGWLEDFHHPHNWVQPYMHSAGAFAGFAGWPEDMVEEFDAKVGECVSLADLAAAEQCYFDLQAMTYDNVTNVFIDQPTIRHYEQMWMEGYYYNPAYFGVYAYSQAMGKGGLE